MHYCVSSSFVLVRRVFVCFIILTDDYIINTNAQHYALLIVVSVCLSHSHSPTY